MRLRINIEFIGLDEIKVTKFSGSKTLKVSEFKGRVFDFDSFKMVDSKSKTDFCIGVWGGDGSLEEPWELAIKKRNYDSGKHEIVEIMHAKLQRQLIVERTIMP